MATAVQIASPEWLVVRNGHDVWTPEDFADGCHIRLRADTGQQWGTGENKWGETVTKPLYVPLCTGCDEPLDGNVCHSCCYVHADLPGAA